MYPFEGVRPSPELWRESLRAASPGAQRFLVQAKDPRSWMTKRQHMGLASLFKTFIPNYCLALTSTNIDRGVFGQRDMKSPTYII